MNELTKLTSQRIKTGTLYVIWTMRPRITIVHISKGAKRGQYKYQFDNIDKYHIPLIFKYYRSTSVEFEGTPTNLKSKISKFVLFDGYCFQEFEHQNNPKDVLNKGKYMIEILKNIRDETYMKTWLDNNQQRYELAYKSLQFLANSEINPSLSTAKQKGFSEKIKSSVISEFKSQNSMNLYYKGYNIILIKDCVGLWTCDLKTKKNILQDVDCIASYDIEHVVSNSYGVDNTDLRNAVLLDSHLNRKKQNIMLFLIPNNLVYYIRRKRFQQNIFLSSQQYYNRKNLILKLIGITTISAVYGRLWYTGFFTIASDDGVPSSKSNIDCLIIPILKVTREDSH